MQNFSKQVIGIIGGSGLYEMKGLEEVKEIALTTPFGNPSDSFISGILEGREIVFLPRHGSGHRILPSEINFRANIFALKVLGVEWIISVSAVGSMKEEIKPGEVVIPDQFFDRTRSRPNSFFGSGIAGHITFSDPVCPDLTRILADSAREVGTVVHEGGVYICIEGPQFSTRAESRIFRGWGVDIIGMTNLPEARLAREAEICYGTLAMVTDYDCWHGTEEDVTIDMVIQVIKKNTSLAQDIIRSAVKEIPTTRSCECPDTLQHAILTNEKVIPKKIKKSLKPIIGKYIK